MDVISKLGYKNNSPFKNYSKLNINTPSGIINMDNVNKRLLAIGNNSGEVKILEPNSGNYKFNDNSVTEIPINMNNIPSPANTKLWNTVFNKAKLKYGGILEKNHLINYAHDEYMKKKGGYLLNREQLNKYQEGGSIPPSAPLKIKDDNLTSWVFNLKNANLEVPESVKEELKVFASDDKSLSSLDIDFIRTAMPNTYKLYNNPGYKNKINEATAFMKTGGTISPIVTGAIKNTNPFSSIITPNTQVKYKKGGVIRTGIVKGYNPETGDYTII